MRVCIAASAAFCVLATPFTASAQLTAAQNGPIVYGHHHLNVTSADEQKKFWVDTIVTVGTRDIIKFPNVLVFLTERPPTGGTKGTTVNHVGFWVPSTRAMVDRVTDWPTCGFRAAGRPPWGSRCGLVSRPSSRTPDVSPCPRRLTTGRSGAESSSPTSRCPLARRPSLSSSN